MDASFEPCVVVGVDASETAGLALDWAADEAARRGARLRIGYAWSLSPYRLPDADRGDLAANTRKVAEDVLAHSAGRAAERHPELRVETELLADEPVPGLLQLAEEANLLVVGSRGLNAFSSVLLGSVSHALVAHAPVPVVVVRPHGKETEALPEAERTAVVLGVAPDESHAPVEFAFAEAQRRGAEVVAVRTWMYPQTIPGHISVPPDEEREIMSRETAEVEALLAVGRKSYPDVPVRTEVGLGGADEALVEASRRAALVVVGTRRHRPRFALAVGRVANRVLHHAHCAVAVVPV